MHRFFDGLSVRRSTQTRSISEHGITYRLPFKYKLTASYTHPEKLTQLHQIPGGFTHAYLSLTPDGQLTMNQRYEWDGPSGPTIDTSTFMRGSLVHDAIYQMSRERLLDSAQWEANREVADKLLRKICRDDGMNWFRAWYVYLAVRVFGRRYARPK